MMPLSINDEQGFTLVELMVVVVIVGILAGFAVPSFLNQRSKGQEACAKSQLRTMQTTVESIYSESGTYAGVSLARLNELESSIVSSDACGSGSIAQVGALSGTSCDESLGTSQNSYCLSQSSAAGRTYVLARINGGPIQRICAPLGAPCSDGSW